MKVYGVTGWKNSGKTHLVERLVAEFCARGMTVSTVKHAHHSTDIDQPGRDSHRHRAAGAREVILASGQRWALMHELRGAPEPEIGALLTHLSPVDLVLVEGYKAGPHPKIEAYRAALNRAPLAGENRTIRALASDTPIDAAVPVLDLDATGAIADFIQSELRL